MIFKTTVKYEEAYIPPRCRKPRYRIEYKEAEFTLREADKIELALTTKSIDKFEDYFLFEGELYKKAGMTVEEFVKRFQNAAGFGYRPLRGYENTVKTLEMDFLLSEMLCVKGELYQKVHEPCYKIATFGMGGNHGGTALMIDSCVVPTSDHFNALQKNEAIEAAKKVALGRGDTEDVKRIGNGWEIIVHMPEAVKKDPQTKAKEHEIAETRRLVNERLSDIMTDAYADQILTEEFLDQTVRYAMEYYEENRCVYTEDIRRAIGRSLVEMKGEQK